MNRSLLLAAAISVALWAGAARAAEIIPINFDDPGEGYNEATPAAPVGGNPGTTIGKQRQVVAQFAADLWGGVLVSNVPVYVGAQFNPLAPNVLGSAGATFIFRDFSNAAVPDTWYSAALAEARSGIDLNSLYVDITSEFSSNFTFYYGLDGNTPTGQVNFLDVVMHEFGHGLGFQNFENEASGAFSLDYADIFSTFTYDNTTGKHWPQMTISERQESALNYGNVVFDGASASAGAGLILGPRSAFLRVTAPGAVAGDYAHGVTQFGPAATPANFGGSVVLGLDAANASGPTTTDGCTPLANAGAVAGNIALLDRGDCTIATKTRNAQDAGATGVMIANTDAQNPPPNFIGVDASIVIPTIVVTQVNGVAFKANLPIQASFVIDPSKLQGADNAGRPRLFMPNPVQGGSSGSHYDSIALPNLLMEPLINSTLLGALNLDITPNLLKDTGWTLNPGNAKINGCDTSIDAVNDAGIIIGANVEATSNVCGAASVDRSAYQSCMAIYRHKLVASGLITGEQGGRMMACAAKIVKNAN